LRLRKRNLNFIPLKTVMLSVDGKELEADWKERPHALFARCSTNT
jgi:hypothetical protein